MREFLADTGMTAEQIDRVAYLVGHHHSPAQIDGIDYQILIEADYIVNASESGYGQQAIRTFMEHTMKTATGIRLTKTVFECKMIQKHCFECGTALIEKELEEEGIVPYCPKCQQYRFPMYNVAVSMIVVDEETGKILLIQQYGKPSYILVAGYVNRGEAEEHAVVREVREETGLE